MSLFMQAFLVAVFVTIAFIDSHTTQIHIFRPVVVGPVVGLIMGDVQTGFAVGITVELMFLAVIFVGTAVPPYYQHSDRHRHRNFGRRRNGYRSGYCPSRILYRAGGRDSTELGN